MTKALDAALPSDKALAFAREHMRCIPTDKCYSAGHGFCLCKDEALLLDAFLCAALPAEPPPEAIEAIQLGDVLDENDAYARSAYRALRAQGIDHAPQSTADQNAAPQSEDNRLKIEVEWDEENQTFVALGWLEPGCLCAGYGATVRAAVNDLLDEMRAEP